jgi:hypothetical protein
VLLALNESTLINAPRHRCQLGCRQKYKNAAFRGRGRASDL